MSDAVSVMLTFGRASACEVLAQWQRQSVRVPLFVYIDEAPELDASRTPPGVMAVHRPRVGTAPGVGLARHHAVMAAIEWAKLSPDGALVLFEDDDFYARDHVERTLQGLAHADFVTARTWGLEQEAGGPVAVVETDSGACNQGTWGLRVSAYRRSGGYEDVRVEDGQLVRALARVGVLPVGHRHLTHVRRRRLNGLSALAYDRERIRRLAKCAHELVPAWTDECERLDRFVREHA